MKNLIYISVFIILTIVSVSAQSTDNLTSYLNGSNAGTEFYLTFPPCFEKGYPEVGDTSVKIYVVSAVKQEVTVEVEGKSYKVKKIIDPFKIAEFGFSINLALPYRVESTPTPVEKVYKGNAIHIKSDYPIVVYGSLQFKYSSEGYLAIPVSALGTEYVIASYPQFATSSNGIDELPSHTNIVAAYDNTEVTFTMGGDSSKFGSRTSGGLRKGQKSSVTMMKGDVWCFAASIDGHDLSGSVVTASKPVGIVSGNQCANIPAGINSCNYICEMELPTYTWGKVYHVPFNMGRQKAPIIRVFAKEPNTKVYRDGQFWFDIPLSSREEGKSFVEKRLFDKSRTQLAIDGESPCKVISADKPIYIMFYNPGPQDDNLVTSPFQLLITPLEQFRKEIVITRTPLRDEPKQFIKNKVFVNLIYQLNEKDSIPKDLEFGTFATGPSLSFSWNNIESQFGPSTGYKFMYQSNGNKFALKRLELPNDFAVYKIRAAKPFTAYIQGSNQGIDFSYPASLSLYDIESKDTISPNPHWIQQCNGSVMGKNGKNNATIDDSSNNLTPSSKLGLIFMDADSSFNYKFEVDSTFIPGLSTATEWTLNVVDPKYDAKARLVFIDRNGNDTIITLRYSPTIYDLTQKNNELQLVKIGETQSAYIELTNRNLRSPLIISDITLKSGKRGFILPNRIYPLTIEPGKSTLIEISFTGSALGRFRDTLIVHTGCGIKEKAINEAFVGEAYISSTDLDFGLVDIGQKEIQNLIIKNTGNHQLKITGINGPYLGQNFKLVNWPNITSQNPILLSPNETRQFTVEFTPTEQINYADSITLNSNADGVDSISVFKGSGKNVSSLVNTNDYYLDYSLIQSHNILSINFNPANFNPIDISLFDILGNNRYSQRLNLSDKNTNHSFYLDSFTSGIYILSIKQGNKLKIEKILVK